MICFNIWCSTEHSYKPDFFVQLFLTNLCFPINFYMPLGYEKQDSKISKNILSNRSFIRESKAYCLSLLKTAFYIKTIMNTWTWYFGRETVGAQVPFECLKILVSSFCLITGFVAHPPYVYFCYIVIDTGFDGLILEPNHHKFFCFCF